MARWSGKGIPPTRKKLHRYREQQRLEREQAIKDSRIDIGRFEREWRRLKADRLLEVWGDSDV